MQKYILIYSDSVYIRSSSCAKKTEGRRKMADPWLTPHIYLQTICFIEHNADTQDHLNWRNKGCTATCYLQNKFYLFILICFSFIENIIVYTLLYYDMNCNSKNSFLTIGYAWQPILFVVNKTDCRVWSIYWYWYVLVPIKSVKNNFFSRKH